jgi:hypothetical protein
LFDTPAPKYCPSCYARERKESVIKPCLDCGAKIFVKPHWEHQPNYCPTCRDKFRRNAFEITCGLCGEKFEWNNLWKMGDIPFPEYCLKCQENKFTIFIKKNQSRKSYTLNRDTEFYRAADQIDHFILGSIGTHKWTDAFANASIEDIINAAADLAASTDDDIMEFTTHGDKRIVKYDIGASLVVIFDPIEEKIITTFMLHNDLQTVANKVLKGEWVGDSSMINKKIWETPK